MTTEPYTPDEAELIGCYAGAMEEHAGENYATAKADAERGVEAIKAKARAEAFNDARHNMQLSLDAAIKPIRAEAWDEGAEHAAMRPDLSANPYRDEREAND